MWLGSLEQSPIPTAELFEVRRLIWKAGRKNLARTLLELLADSLEDTGNTEDALTALRELTRLSESKPTSALLERLVERLRKVRADSPSLKAVLERHPIGEARRPLNELEAIECWLDHDVGTVVEVAGKGVGRVVDLNLQLENVKVDVGSGRPMSIPFGAVRKHLRPLPDGDIRRRKVEDPESLKEFVESQPGEALVQVLESLGESSDVSAIKGALDGVLPPARWNSWWAKARKHPRVLSSGSGSRLRYAVSHSAQGADEILLEELRNASGVNRLKIARRLAERGAEIAGTTASELIASLPEMESSEPGIAWQAAGVLTGLPGGEEAARESKSRLLSTADPLALLSGVSDRGLRWEALEAIAEANPEEWPSIWAEWILSEENPQNLKTLCTRLEEEGHGELIDRSMEVVFRNHAEHPAQFIWACETMTDDDSPHAVRQRMTPSVLEKIPDTITRKEFSSYRSRGKGLLDGGKVAIRLLMDAASPAQATRFSQRIARLDTVEPQRVSLVEQAARHQRGGETDDDTPVLAATKAAVERKREELKTLVEVDIPKTLKGINAAAAEGDLRENFEYHMLRDRQELQSARAAKLQQELSIVRILEPGAADTSVVNIGTVVHFEAEGGSAIEPITILGAWDADLDRRVFANGSGLAQRLLGASVGDEIEADEGPATISRIEAWQG
jgi:transcription elongation factor GreA